MPPAVKPTSKPSTRQWLSSGVVGLHFARALAYLGLGVAAFTVRPSLKESIPVLFILSVLACVESAISAGTAQLAARRAREAAEAEEEGEADAQAD